MRYVPVDGSGGVAMTCLGLRLLKGDCNPVFVIVPCMADWQALGGGLTWTNC